MAQQPSLFISYGQADDLFIEQLVPLLEQVFPDHETWYDKINNSPTQPAAPLNPDPVNPVS